MITGITRKVIMNDVAIANVIEVIQGLLDGQR